MRSASRIIVNHPDISKRLILSFKVFPAPVKSTDDIYSGNYMSAFQDARSDSLQGYLRCQKREINDFDAIARSLPFFQFGDIARQATCYQIRINEVDDLCILRQEFARERRLACSVRTGNDDAPRRSLWRRFHLTILAGDSSKPGRFGSQAPVWSYRPSRHCHLGAPQRRWVPLIATGAVRRFSRHLIAVELLAGKIWTVRWAQGINERSAVPAYLQSESEICGERAGTWT